MGGRCGRGLLDGVGGAAVRVVAGARYVVGCGVSVVDGRGGGGGGGGCGWMGEGGAQVVGFRGSVYLVH